MMTAMPVISERGNDDARRLFDLVNAERAKSGLAGLAWDERLAEQALDHSRLQAERRTLAHQLAGEPDLLQRLDDVPAKQSGENVAVSGSIGGAHQALMQSPGHRENILNAGYNAIGIGVVRSGPQVWVTEDFAGRIDRVSDDEAVRTLSVVFAKARKQAGLPPLEARGTGRVQKLACDMADQGDLDTGTALALPHARFAAAFTSLDVSHLPENTMRLSRARDVTRYEVGACFANTTDYPSGVYWVALVLFGR
jgi:hypothetical protein